jgi:hypothetical protein
MKDFFKREKQKLDTHKEKLSSDLVKLSLAYKTSDGGIFENETDAIRRQDTLNNRKLYGEFYDSIYI